MTDYLLTCLTNLRSLGVNIKSVDAEIADAKERRDLIQKGAVKFRANLPVGDLGQVNKIKKLYQRVAGLLKRATAHGLLKVDRYNHLLAHLNWQRLRVEADYYACKAKKALKSQDDSIARKNLYHARRLLANSKVNHPGRKEKFVSVNELLGAIQKQESESPEPPEEIPSSDHLENMTFMTDINQKKRSF
jgi:hypothetical protein|tara:strand:+ start:1068 stop:1637 length:570 start_codon:yes stop_codon:yes gene_type:complete